LQLCSICLNFHSLALCYLTIVAQYYKLCEGEVQMEQRFVSDVDCVEQVAWTLSPAPHVQRLTS
jgi:hypothetical protein